MNENDVLFQKVTQAYSEKKIRVLLSGVEPKTCVNFWNNTSFSFIHQAENIPSHLFHRLFNLLQRSQFIVYRIGHVPSILMTAI